jgi:trimeric autotransporter adhesin
MKKLLRINAGTNLFVLTFLFISAIPQIVFAQAPANDDHGGFPLFSSAPSLTVNGASCTTTTNGTLRNATISAGIPAFSCATNSFLFDVWYSFTATSSSHTIALDNYGTTYTRRQFAVYQFNTLGALSAVTCSALSTSGTAALTVTFTDYSPGTTYLVRVIYPNTVNTGLNGATATFRLCVTTGTNSAVQPVQTGKSYTNITRPSGGTIQVGDVLEFRAGIFVGNFNPGAIFNVSFHDTIPTGLSYVANSIKFESNEGLAFESGITGSTTLTDASGDDEAVYNSGVIRVNVTTLPRFGGQGTATNRQWVYQGSPAVTPITYASAGGGKIHSQGRPNQFNGYSIVVVRYQATVTAATGTTFNTSNGAYRYKTTTSSFNDVGFPQTIVNFPKYTVYVSAPSTALCQGGTGVNVYPNGNFGSGTTQHDSTQLTIAPQYTWKPFSNGSPGDGFFAVVNNSSANASFTNKYASFPSAGVPDTMRVFGVWDIIGDHTGASNVDSGNLAVPWGTNGGYMAVVNAAYGINTAVQKNITGLCSDTYYEFSAYFKNVCAGCSNDTAGRGWNGDPLFKSYLSSKTQNDSAGVSPDLTYTIDGVDYYTTGNIIYDKRWVKKGFLFKTGPAQTSVTLSIRNNAPGGGGNDWAVDDIALITCFPGMTYSPTSNPAVCANNTLIIRDTVRSVFNNYVQYKWQRWAASGPGPWTDIPGASGTATPVWNGSTYEYVSPYTIPPAATTAANAGDKYRVVVASTGSNLASSTCSYSDPTSINLNVLTTCGPPLKVDLISVSGKLIDNNNAKISWVTSREDEQVSFTIERSDDGINFKSIASVNGYNNTGAESNYYTYTDAQPVTGKVYYRVVMISKPGTKKYSKTVQLNPAEKNEFRFVTVINPFSSELIFEVFVPQNVNVKAELIDQNGQVVKKKSYNLSAGTNTLSITDADVLSRGIYTLRLHNNGSILTKRVMKK